MNEAFIGFIWLFGGNFAPRSSAYCNGQTLSIAQNTALFSILGTTYGGDGMNTFKLPDLQGRTAIGWGNGPGLSYRQLGEIGGTENVSILSSNMPGHFHNTSSPKGAIVAGDATTPENNYLALSPKIGSGPNATTLKTYATPAAATAVADKIKPMAGNNGNSGVAGGGLPINVVQPYLALTYCIVIQGVFPSRN